MDVKAEAGTESGKIGGWASVEPEVIREDSGLDVVAPADGTGSLRERERRNGHTNPQNC
jgi:hypothetical protein